MKGTILILTTCLLFGCSEKRADLSPEKPLVFTSILPQAGLVKMIVGEHAQVIPLVGEGQSPHAYEPTAQQLTKLAKSDVLMTIGVPFESHLLRKIRPLYPDLSIIETQAGIKRQAMPHEHSKQCNHEHGAKDPHIWLAPLVVKDIAENMFNALKDMDPENAQSYQSNYETLALELDILHEEIKTRLAPHKNARFFVFHPSFGYFATAYGLEQIPIELNGKSPSPRQLATLIEQAQVDGVKVIFVSKQFPKGSANAVATAIDGRVVQLDPLAEDVVANLRKIAESIFQALEQ